MSLTSMEDLLITPWVGSTCYRNSLTIVVLSSNSDIIESISNALRYVHTTSDFRWKLAILRSFSIEDIGRQLYLTGKLSIDFVIIAMDTSKLFCVEWARKALEAVHPDLRIHRVALVNASNTPINAMAVNSDEIITFSSENKLEIFTADVSKQEDAQFMARKLLTYIEVSVGVKTGIPNLNV